MRRVRAAMRVPAAGTALFLLLLGWYILTMSGHTYSGDEETMLAVGERLIDYRDFAIPRGDLMIRGPGVDQRSYSRYGPAQSLLAIPFILAGRAIAPAAPPLYERFIVRLFVLLIPTVLTAATVVLLYAWVQQVGYSRRIALIVALLYGFTSMAWPYSRTFFAEPLATMFLVLCAYAIRREEQHWWMIAGAAAAGALAAKFQTLLAMPLLGMYALLVSWRGDSDSSARVVAERLVMGLLGIALPISLLFYYNTRLFGGPLNSGYGSINLSDWLNMQNDDGLYGLTLSSGKGFLFYSPTILLGLIGLGFQLRRQWRESLLALGMLTAHIAFYSRYTHWHGAGSWGPRYLMFAIPFCYLPIAGLLATVAAWRNRVVRVLIGGLVAISLLVQILPVLVNFDTYILLSNDHDRFFTPSASPLIAHPRIWAERVALWWTRVVAPQPGTAVLRDGFSFSEGDRRQSELLPRWSHADGQIQIYPPANVPINGRIVVGDHRPWPLPRADFALLLDGQPLAGVQRTDLTGQGIVWELRFRLTPEQARRGATLTLHSDTWNPTLVTQDNPRNEDLGLRVEALELRQGEQPLRLVEALPIPPPQNSRRAQWLWYQDTPNPHLFDLWIWYLAVSGMPAQAVKLLLALIGLPSLLCFGIGLGGIVAELRRAPGPADTHPSALMPAVVPGPEAVKRW